MTTATRITFSSTLAAAALACAASGLSAQTIYRELDDEGRTTFTDRRSTQVPRLRAIRSENVARHVARSIATRTAISSRRAARIDANEAAGRLAQALALRDRGGQPLYGERANGPGARPVNARYWRRQDRLQHAVEQAQRRSEETARALRARR